MAKKKNVQAAVIGLGRFGTNVALTLTDLGCKVLALDSDIDKVNNMAANVANAMQVDVTKEEVLPKLGLENFDIVVLTIGSNLQASILTALVLKNLGVKRTVAKASSELHKRVLEKIGVDYVVFPEKDSAIKLAHSLMSLNLIEYLEISPGYRIAEIIIQEKYHGKTLSEVNIRNKFRLNVLAIRRQDDVRLSPQAEDVLLKGDMIVVIGSSKDLKTFSDDC